MVLVKAYSLQTDLPALEVSVVPVKAYSLQTGLPALEVECGACKGIQSADRPACFGGGVWCL